MIDIPETILEPLYDLEQYAMLMRCSRNKDLAEWNEWRKANPEEEIMLQCADFIGKYCKGADFRGGLCNGAIFSLAHCEGADFRGANCQGASFFIAHCEDAQFDDALCQGADFTDAHCENAKFRRAHCQHAIFYKAHCKKAVFEGAHCEGADFTRACDLWNFRNAICEETNFSGADCDLAVFANANCKGAIFERAECYLTNFIEADCTEAIFRKAHCQHAMFYRALCQETDFSEAICESAKFSSALFSSSTRFLGCTINDASDFSYTALGNIMVEPGKRARMEYNIRRFAWEKWYKEQEVPLTLAVRRFFCFQFQTCTKIASFLANTLFLLLSFVWLCPVRFFWHVSDYGYSTVQVIKWFIIFSLLFTSLYTCFPNMLMLNNTPMNSPLPGRFFQMLAFATSTMVTLGFSNINVAIENGKPVFAGMFVVSCNLIVGYFMLAVLVTRLGILFQSQGPGEPRTKKVKQ